MLLLAVDTAGQIGGALLARNDNASLQPNETEVLGTRALEPRKFSTQLISAIADLLRLNELTLADLDAVAVVSGPGFFTGLRVGLSAVKAIAEATGKPILSLSRLAIMASAAEAFGSDVPAAGVVHVVLDAGRGEFYHGSYRDGGRTCVAESLQSATALADSLERLPGWIVASEPTVLDALNGMNQQPCRIAEVTAREALPLALAAWRARQFADVATLDANYLRRVHPVLGSKLSPAPESAESRAGRP